MRIATELLKYSAVVLALGLIFSGLGVYDSEEVPFWPRFVFWTTSMAVGAAATAAIGPIMSVSRLENLPAIFKIGIVSAIISVPITIVLNVFFGMRTWSLTYWSSQYGYVLVISLIITTGAYMLQTFRASQAAPTPEGDPTASFLERLPVKYRTADLHAISSEDHYLRVHTSLGEELILMRLADAVRELAGADGLKVHRSWWVAKSGIQDEKRVDGRSLLILPSGTEVPVSRSFRAEAKAAGLIR